jgi:signal transduction histidine kinase
VFELAGNSHAYLTLARPLPGTRPDQGQMYVMQRSLDSETAFLRTMQTHLVELGLVALLAALLAGWLIAERITSPVRRIVRAAEEMERGNYDYVLDVPDRDEIGYLAHRFRDMRTHQRAYIQNLRDIARAKSEFLSVASHELRTPISVISGFQELMVSGKLGELTDRQRQGLEAIERSVKTLQRITEDATRMSQIEGDALHLELESCELHDVIDRSVAAALADAPSRSVQVLTDTASNVRPLELDPRRFVQAISNLVRNGIRFTPDGGTVDVQTRDAGTHVEIRVRDTGVGISPARQVTIFDASHLGQETLNHHSSSHLEFNSAGLGLGLSIARGIIEAHGGTIRVESHPGKGAVFIVRLSRKAVELRSKAA